MVEKKLKLKIGILGLGNISKKYIEIINKRKDIELSAVCDVSSTRLKIIQKQFADVKVFRDIDDFVNNSNIDLAIILTFSGLHYEHTKKCLLNNIHTITEKPIALKLHDAVELAKIAKQKKLSAGVVLQNRFNKSVQFAKNLIENKNIGKKITCNIRIRWCRNNEYYSTPWRGTWKFDGGVVSQQAVHHIDVLQLIGGDIKKISAFTTKRLNKLEAEDTCVAILGFKNGSLGTIEATTSARPIDYEASFSILFEKGLIEIGGIALNKINNFYYIGKNKNYTSQIKKKIF